MVAKRLNNQVMAAVSEQIGALNLEKTIQQRDQGKNDKAEEVLKANAIYLNQSGTDFNSPKLKQAASESVEAAKRLKDEDWTANRKELKKSGYSTSKQQSY